jgi:bacillithiol biosynthesis deacetylase BshB1
MSAHDRLDRPADSERASTSTYGVDVLAFGAHPDDVEIFCGGTLIRLADLGYATAVIDLSRGEAASNGTPEERAKEAEAASRILGLRLRENLGLPDTGIDPTDRAQLVAAVEAIRRHRPEILLLPWIEDRHPDHAAAAALLTRAAYFAGVKNFAPGSDRFVPRQVLYYAMRHRMPPTFVLDTTAAAERKMQAIACYRSQVVRRAGHVPTLLSSSLSLQAIDARDRYTGSLIGVAHGEALRMANVPGLVDPVRFFRENAFPEAFAFEPLR